MSLAISGMGGMGGGAGAGGLTMAHQAHAVGVPPAAQHQQHTTANASSTGTAPPPSMSALGADLIDKNQSGLTLKQVRNRQHLPIVAVDLFAADGSAGVSFFPKKSDDPSKGAPPLFVASISTDITFQSENEVAHKVLRKYLSKSKTFSSLQDEALASTSTTPVTKNKKGKTTNSTTQTVVLEKPHQWLGLRRLSDAPAFIRTQAGVVCSDSAESNQATTLTHAIAEESSADVGINMEDSTLDGVSYPKNDDFDRVVAKVRLHSSKKAVTMLPEEAVQIVFHTAQHLVADKMNQAGSSKPTKSKEKSAKDDLPPEEIIEFPLAVALPAWAMHDATVEALMDATEGTGVFVPRSVAAAAGAVLPSLDGSITPLLSRINTVRSALQKQHQQELIEDPGAIFDDSLILLFFGMSYSGFEATAIQISTVNMTNISCLFSDYKVISNVSFQSGDPISIMEKCTKQLEETMELVAPESDGPAAIVFYGSANEQEKIKARWDSIKVKQEEWKNVPTIVSAPDTVARGTAVMGAVAHGRLTKLTTSVNSSGKKKVKTNLGIRVQNVALAAVGISFNYHGDDKDQADTKWTPIKTIFDFDRQTPAGPHSFDLNAAECAVHKEKGANVTENMNDDEFLKATALYEGSKGIPAREDAALNLRLQVYEKWTRDGEWKKVGDPMEPLVVRTTNTDSKDGEEIRTACEAMVFELSLTVTGLIATSLIGERTSVVVATKEARNSKIRWYAGILFLILFCGGFLFKSWYDDHVLERDTKRLLAFYRHIVPGSIHDGDFHSARYTCYKFRNKKSKLWKKLESKYGEPVLEAHEYEAMKENIDETKSTASTDRSEEEPTVDLDEDQSDDQEL